MHGQKNISERYQKFKEMEGTGKIVCVTGGAGYLASWLIMRLLERGYSVRTTVRSDPKFREDVSHLKALPEATEKLQIFEADLENPESFDDAINGCVGVFLVAQGMNFAEEYTLEKIIKTCVEGTLRILQSCLKSKTVKKVVYTSSADAAMMISNLKAVKEIDETIWSEVDNFISKPEQVIPGLPSYVVSKVLTERACLKFSEEHGLDVVTILPPLVVGPFITPHPPPSVSIALSIISGDVSMMLGVRLENAVHIDDVALAHIFVFECEKAKGRHICSSVDFPMHDLPKFISENYPEFNVPTDLLKDIEEQEPVHLSSDKLLSMGFQFKYDFAEIFGDAIRCAKEKGFL
uniref:Noscapine synthase SDR1 n=2 Tax=Papaver somniferum TaxID=3469 RepID=SDR1_PAPSO|nr:RecName: Full=Noscapine synthase SDR1; AltName: Full=Short-chain dehydrogenase/reductase 1; Short=PsSDR1 [Papaver somniferum]AFB74619.1 short-chain dehydrogenase/reductase [Papaver somniferum]